MEHCLLFLIVNIQVLLFFLCRNPGGKEKIHLDPDARKITRKLEKLQ